MRMTTMAEGRAISPGVVAALVAARRCAAPPLAEGSGASRPAAAPRAPGRRRGVAVRPQGPRLHGRGVRTLAALVLAGLICAALPASAQVLPLPDRDRAKIDALLGAGVVGEALPSQPIADPSVYFPLQERTKDYLVTGGPKAGATQSLAVAKGQRPDGTPAWRLALSPSQAAFLRRTEGGDVLMPAVTDIGEGVVVVTTPPNPFLLTGMRPGETRTLAQQVAVNYLDDPSRQDYSGSLTATYTYVGTYRVTVPAGTYDAILLRLKYAGKVGPAHTASGKVLSAAD